MFSGDSTLITLAVYIYAFKFLKAIIENNTRKSNNNSGNNNSNINISETCIE